MGGQSPENGAEDVPRAQASSQPRTVKRDLRGDDFEALFNNSNGKEKRKAGWDGEGGNEDDDKGPPNKRMMAKMNLSCPYRKRNPLRFNVRDYHACATHSFANMAHLKMHIRERHTLVQMHAGTFSCPRCSQGFDTKSDLDDHLGQSETWDITFGHSADPEDGIPNNDEAIVPLLTRTGKRRVDNWVSLWKFLFPHDRTVPDHTFVPIMEVSDFVAESKKSLARLKDLLELQYRYILNQAGDNEPKIRQGLDRSTHSIYNWIEAVVQDWGQRFTNTGTAAAAPAHLSIRETMTSKQLSRGRGFPLSRRWGVPTPAAEGMAVLLSNASIPSYYSATHLSPELQEKLENSSARSSWTDTTAETSTWSLFMNDSVSTALSSYESSNIFTYGHISALGLKPIGDASGQSVPHDAALSAGGDNNNNKQAAGETETHNMTVGYSGPAETVSTGTTTVAKQRPALDWIASTATNPPSSSVTLGGESSPLADDSGSPTSTERTGTPETIDFGDIIFTDGSRFASVQSAAVLALTAAYRSESRIITACTAHCVPSDPPTDTPQSSTSDSATQPESTNSSASSRTHSFRTGSTSQAPSHRGARGESQQRDGRDDDDEPKKSRPQKRKRTEEGTKRLACPFQKRYPLKHFFCGTGGAIRGFDTIAYVKQHIRRCHIRSPIYCPRCKTAFDDSQKMGEHVMQFMATQLCKERGFPDDTALSWSHNLETSLRARVVKTLSLPEQWFSVWRILFPDIAPPNSCLVDDDVCEHILQYQQFITARGHDIVRNVIRDHGLLSDTEAAFSGDLEYMYTQQTAEELEAFAQRVFSLAAEAIFYGWVNVQQTQWATSSTERIPRTDGDDTTIRESNNSTASDLATQGSRPQTTIQSPPAAFPTPARPLLDTAPHTTITPSQGLRGENLLGMSGVQITSQDENLNIAEDVLGSGAVEVGSIALGHDFMSVSLGWDDFLAPDAAGNGQG